MLGCPAMIVESSRMTVPSPLFKTDSMLLLAPGHDDRSNYKKRTNDAGMLLKTKGRCGKPEWKAGIL